MINVDKLIKQALRRENRNLKDQNRGLKKRLNRVIKANMNYHNGMEYWKGKFELLKQEIDYLHDHFILNDKKGGPVDTIEVKGKPARLIFEERFIGNDV